MFDRMNTCAGYWIIGSRYHSGQGSYLYLKLSQLSRIQYNPGLASWEHQRGSDERQHAAALLRKLKPMIRSNAPHP